MKKFLLCTAMLLSFLTIHAQQLPNYATYSDTYEMTTPITQSGNSAAECEGQRPDINSSEFDENDRILLADLILEYLTSVENPNYDPATDHPSLKYDVVAQHSNYDGNASAWHSDNEVFFSWHRDYIQGLENWLLANGHTQFVPLPAWNPNQSIPSAFQGAVVPEVLNAPFNGIDMELGVIQDGQLEMYTVDDITCGQFNDMDHFAGFIRGGFVQNPTGQNFTSHNAVHGTIGGAMGFVPTASAAAIFWLFHAHVDELYQCYLTRCEDCEPTFIRPTTSQDGCTICFDLSESVGSDNFTFDNLTNSSGTSLNINLDANGCISRRPNDGLGAGRTFTMTISSSPDDCRSDEVHIDFTMPTSNPGNKYNPSCIMALEYPNPIRDNLNLDVQNLGADGNLSVSKVDIYTGAREEILRSVYVRHNEVYRINYNTGHWARGSHALEIRLGEHIYSEIVVKE